MNQLEKLLRFIAIKGRFALSDEDMGDFEAGLIEIEAKVSFKRVELTLRELEFYGRLYKRTSVEFRTPYTTAVVAARACGLGNGEIDSSEGGHRSLLFRPRRVRFELFDDDGYLIEISNCQKNNNYRITRREGKIPAKYQKRDNGVEFVVLNEHSLTPERFIELTTLASADKEPHILGFNDLGRIYT